MATELATAYVALVPSAKGIAGNIARELAPVETAAAATGARAGKNLSGGILSQLPGGAKLAGALGFAAIGLAAFKSAEDVEKAYNRIRVDTGATGKSLDGLEASFRNVAGKTPASFNDVALAIGGLNTRLGVTGPGLEDLSLKFVRLSRITGTDVAENVRDITRVFGDWSIKTGDQGLALDKLFRATQVTGVGLNELSQNVVQFGAPLRNLGFTFDQSVALFSKFEKEGVNIQTVLAGLRFGLKTFARAGEEPIDALRRIIEQIKSAGTAAEANSLAFQVFGVRAGPDMAAAIREGRFELDPLIKAIAGGKDTIDKAAGDVSTLAGKLGVLKNQARLAFAELGTPLLAVATDSLATLLPIATELGHAFRVIAPALPPVVLGLGAFYTTGKLIVPLANLLATGVFRLGVSMESVGATRAASGLGNFAGGLEGLSAKLPAAAGGAAFLGLGLTQAGESGLQGALGIGQMVAGGALLGSVIPVVGTALGALAGGVAGLTVHLLAGGESVDEYRKKFVDLGDALDTIGSKQAAKKFVDQLGETDKIGAGLASQTDLIHAYGAAWKQAAPDPAPFKALRNEIAALALKSPDAANKVVQGLRAMRGEGGQPIIDDATAQRFYAVIDQQIAKTRSATEHKRAADAANRELTSSEQGVAGLSDDTTTSLNDQITALTNLQNAVLAASGGQIGYQQSILNVQRAQEAYNQAVADYGPDSEQARTAQLDLASAQNQAASATLGLDQAQANLSNTYKDRASVDEAIGRLQTLQAEYPETAASLNPLIYKLLELRGKYDGVSGNFNANVTATDNASPILDTIKAKLLGITEGVGVSVTPGGNYNPFLIPGRASGGSVLAGAPYLVGEHGPELLVPRTAGTVIPAAATAALLGGATSPSGAALVIEGNIYGDAHLRAVLEQHAARLAHAQEVSDRMAWE